MSTSTTTSQELVVGEKNENVIIFGDFSLDETIDIMNSKSSKTDKQITCHHPTTQSTRSVCVIFGDFSEEECLNAQTEKNENKLFGGSVRSVSKFVPRSFPSFQFPSNTISYNAYPCLRCGYTNHSIEKCVARRNVYGDKIPSYISPISKHKKKIMYPTSPTSSSHSGVVGSGPIYYNTHLSSAGTFVDKTDYNQFIFTEDDIQEWIDYEKNNLYNNNEVDVETMYYDEPNLDFILGYNYALANHMLYAYW